MAEESGDWLFPDAERKQAEQQQSALIFAQKYLVFAQEPRAKELLEHWTMAARRKRLPDNASLGELAAHNAFCRFIEGIHAQIELAMNGPLGPQPRKNQ